MSKEADLMMRALTRKFAKSSLTQEQIKPVCDALMASPFEITGVKVCELGICIDHLWDGAVEKMDLTPLTDTRLGELLNFEVFPLGTILPDRTRVRSRHEL